MSLLNSIFGGEAPDKGASKANQKDTPDLFGNRISVPAVLHKKALSPQKQKKSAKGTTDSKNTDDDSSSSDDKKQDSSTQQIEDAAAEETSTKKGIVKKTKEEIKEEEERTIFVGNLPPDISRRALAGIFKPCGTVASARLRSVGVAGVKLPPDQAGNQVR
jgi:RNA recognition motif-containing protein